MSPARQAVPRRNGKDKAERTFSDELIWFEPDEKQVRNVRRSLQFGGGALLVLVALTVYVVAAFGNARVAAEIGVLVAGMFLVFGVIHWITRSTLGTAIGFEAGEIILRNHKGEESRSPLHEVMYNDAAIATPDMAVLLGNNKTRLYDADTVNEQILPRLEAAQAISAAQMRKLLMRLQRPQSLLFMLVIITLAALVAASLSL